MPILIAGVLACRPSQPVAPDPTETVPPVGACDADPALFLEVTPSEGVVSNQIVLAVSASRPAPVAARCVATADPEDVHFVEDPASTGVHSLVFGGLLPGAEYTCVVVATCPEAAPVSVTWTTGAPPAELSDLAVAVDPALGSTGGYTLTNWRPSDCPEPSDAPGWMALWDERGTLRWWWPLESEWALATEVHLHPTEPWIDWGGGQTPLGYPRRVDPIAGVVYEAVDMPVLGESMFSHDMRTLPDGRLLTMEYVPNTVGALSWIGFAVRVWDPVAEAVVFELNSQELVDAGILSVPRNGQIEPYHANAFDWEETADGPELTLSLCREEVLLNYDVTTRQVRWVFGGRRGWTVVDALDAPLTDLDIPRCTHGVEVDGSRILVYDNGRDREQSAVSEWEIDGAARSARRTWHWTEPGWYEFILGDVEDLGTGRVLVTQARMGCGPPATSVEVVRATGEVAVRATFPEGGIYRSEHVDACRLFSSARDCEAVAARMADLAPLFVPAR